MASLSFYRSYDMNSPLDISANSGLYNPSGITSSTEAIFADNSYAVFLSSTPTSPFTFSQTQDGSWDVETGTLASVIWTSQYFGDTVYALTGLSANINVNYYVWGYDSNNDGETELYGMAAETAYWLSGADTVTGSAGNDTLSGYQGNDSISGGIGHDVLAGGLGNDTLDGGEGTDIADYGDMPENTASYSFAITGNLGSGNVKFNTLSGTGTYTSQTDTLRNLEILRGTSRGDKIDLGTSKGFQDGIQGMLGSDTIIGGDTLSGTSNDGDFIDYRSFSAPKFKANVVLTNTDSATSTTYATAKLYLGSTLLETDLIKKIHGVIGSGGNDSVTGSAADDWFRGMAGNDTFVGGAGNDWIDYRGLTSGLTITLAAAGATQSITAGSHGTDTISNVENISGGLGADKLTGNELNNTLRGREGNDTLDGAGGMDYADYKNASSSITVIFSAATSAASSGADGTDTLLNIEGIRGSSYGDTLTGSTGNQFLDGRDGNDTLNGGLGNDTLIGGNGVDKLIFSTALGSTNIDALPDFLVGMDKIILDDDIFTALGLTGTTTGLALTASKFQLGSAANDVGDRIIYNQSSGALYYDADGTASIAAVQFATLTAKPLLTAADFLVIA
ncbi:MAG: calcium-binding protein [Dechloromonas sp.]|nr:calcium-binding protein [Dechloromonas sp.]